MNYNNPNPVLIPPHSFSRGNFDAVVTYQDGNLNIVKNVSTDNNSGRLVITNTATHMDVGLTIFSNLVKLLLNFLFEDKDYSGDYKLSDPSNNDIWTQLGEKYLPPDNSKPDGVPRAAPPVLPPAGQPNNPDSGCDDPEPIDYDELPFSLDDFMVC